MPMVILNVLAILVWPAASVIAQTYRSQLNIEDPLPDRYRLRIRWLQVPPAPRNPFFEEDRSPAQTPFLPPSVVPNTCDLRHDTPIPALSVAAVKEADTLARHIRSLPPWRDSTHYPARGWRAQIALARRIQRTPSIIVERAFRQYMREAIARSDWREQISKPYLLLRIVFAIPEDVTDLEPFYRAASALYPSRGTIMIDGPILVVRILWSLPDRVVQYDPPLTAVTSASEPATPDGPVGPNGPENTHRIVRVNFSWPIAWRSGRPVLTGKDTEWRGQSLDFAMEYRLFRASTLYRILPDARW